MTYTDTYTNLVASLGVGKDKKAHGHFVEAQLTDEQLEDMYAHNWLCGKVIDIPVDDMTRKWRTIYAPSIYDRLEEIRRFETKIGLRRAFNEAQKCADLYGGAVIILGVEGTGTFDTPLHLADVKVDSLQFIRVVDRTDISCQDVLTNDVSHERYRQPLFYSTGNERIHYTRTLQFEGIHLPWRLRQRKFYWGGSKLKRFHEALLNANSVPSIVASLLFEAKIDVISIDNLMGAVSIEENRQKLIERFQLADRLKSVNNMLLLDSTEQFDRKQINFSGLADLILKYMLLACAAADIPATRLLEQSAVGLNSTGEGELRNYYDGISAGQEVKFRPQLTRFDEIMARSILGYRPPDWEFKFNPLWQMSDDEVSKIELTRAQRDNLYMQLGVITPEIVAKQLRTNGTYDAIDDDYIDVLGQ